MILEIDEQERLILLDLVAAELNELPSEIRHTDSASYRDDLRLRQQSLRDLQARIAEHVEA